jgi:hypothetical protein
MRFGARIGPEAPGQRQGYPFWSAFSLNAFSSFFSLLCNASPLLRAFRSVPPRGREKTCGQPSAAHPSFSARSVLSSLSVVPPFQRPKSAELRTAPGRPLAGCRTGLYSPRGTPRPVTSRAASSDVFRVHLDSGSELRRRANALRSAKAREGS